MTFGGVPSVSAVAGFWRRRSPHPFKPAEAGAFAGDCRRQKRQTRKRGKRQRQSRGLRRWSAGSAMIVSAAFAPLKVLKTMAISRVLSRFLGGTVRSEKKSTKDKTEASGGGRRSPPLPPSHSFSYSLSFLFHFGTTFPKWIKNNEGNRGRDGHFMGVGTKCRHRRRLGWRRDRGRRPGRERTRSGCPHSSA